MSGYDREEENRRKNFNTEEHRIANIRNERIAYEDQAEVDRLKKEKASRSAKYLDQGNLSAFAAENELDYSESRSIKNIIEESNFPEENDLPQNNQEYYEYEHYRVLTGQRNYWEESLKDDLYHLASRGSTPAENSRYIINYISSMNDANKDSMKEVDLLELNSKFLLWNYPDLSNGFDFFFKYCRDVIRVKDELEDGKGQNNFTLSEGYKSKNIAPLYESYLKRFSDQKKMVEDSYAQLRDKIFDILAFEYHPKEIKIALHECAFFLIHEANELGHEYATNKWYFILTSHDNVYNRLKNVVDNYMDSRDRLIKINGRIKYLKIKNNW